MNASGRALATLATLGLVVVTASACFEDPTEVGAEITAALIGVQPVNGAVGIDIGSSVVITFDHAIGQGMEAYVHLSGSR